MPSIPAGLAWTLAIAFAALTIGSGIRLLSLQWATREDDMRAATARRNSLGVWWVLTLVFASALIFGRLGLALMFCVASLLGVREFHRIFRQRAMDASVLAIALYLIALAHYAGLAFLNSLWSLWAFPLVAMSVLTIVELTLGRTKDYLRSTAGYYWAGMLIVFGLSHAVATTYLPVASDRTNVGCVGWCILLVVLTETNDIAQALVGRVLGRRKIAPTFSPGKTWEGLVGGLLITSLLAILCSPLLSGLTLDRTWGQGVAISMAVGFIVSTAGFLGDLNISGLKREAGVKDSGTLLPGMGGVLDRIDSLTFSAPAFYYFSAWLLR